LFVPAVVLVAFVAAGAVCPETGACAQSITNDVRVAPVEAIKRWLIEPPF
jgi:hypothetical protein